MRTFKFALIFLFFLPGNRLLAQNSLTVNGLKAEYLQNPLGIDVAQPRLSWQSVSTKRGVKQVAYHILVASSLEKLKQGIGDLWNSAIVQSDHSLNVVYKGKNLKSRQWAFWKVRVWDNYGTVSQWSGVSHWSMGILTPSEWQAQWIGLDTFSSHDSPHGSYSRLSARYLRKELNVRKEIKSATAYISGLGLYELYVNGKKVGNDVLSPTLKEYNKTVPYNTLDISGYLKEGNNALGVILGNGHFFSMRPALPEVGIPLITNYGYPKLLMQVQIVYADGSEELTGTDNQWKITDQGPIIANSEFDGEEYDANKEESGWAEPGFNDSAWRPVKLVKAPAEHVEAQMNENIKVMETLAPKRIWKTNKGTIMLDMGQNMAGWLQIKVKGGRGDTIKLRFAETLKDTNELYLANIRSAKVTDKLILKDGEWKTWEPRFSYHGFRYVEVSGLQYDPSITDFTGKVIYDHMSSTGNFTSSNQTLNNIFKNAYWTIRSNYRSIPTDCPQRDERMGWLGDRSINSYGESFLFDNIKLYSKWMGDIKESQLKTGSIPDVAPTYWKFYNDGVTWPSTFIIIPEMLRKQFGDSLTFRRNYPYMKLWITYMKDKYMKNWLLPIDSYGDWCMPPENQKMIHSEDPARKTTDSLISSAYFIYCLQLMQQYAAALDLPQDKSLYADMESRMKQAFNNQFYHEETHTYSNNTVTANILPLTFGIVPEQDKALIAKNIEHKTLTDFDGHVSTGLIGAQWLMRGLTTNGYKDLAYRIATNTTYPSWGYMISQGATTIWELWNGNTADPSMNSGNHVMLLGDLLVWYYEDLAGIKSDEIKTAFKKIIMKPCFPEGLNEVNASYDSYYGIIKSHWKKNKAGLSWDITVPVNATAVIYFPVPTTVPIYEENKLLKLSRGVSLLKTDGNYTLVEIGSGNYHFRVVYP